MKPMNKALTELVRQREIYASGIGPRLSSRASKASEEPPSFIQKSPELTHAPLAQAWSISENLCFKNQKVGRQDGFKKLRKQCQKMLKYEKSSKQLERLSS
jgi:hypothetical protein